MSAFSFDAKAALHQAQKCREPPNRPNRPNRGGSDGAGLGGLGGLGRGRACDPEMTPEDLARDFHEERSAIRKHDGGQDRTDELDPDAGAYLDFLHLHGPSSYGAAATALGWGATRAWRAEAKLRVAGLVVYSEGKAQPC